MIFRNKFAAYAFLQILAVIAVYRSSSIQTTLVNISNAPSTWIYQTEGQIMTSLEYNKPSITGITPTSNTTTTNASLSATVKKRLPTLKELTSITGNYSCPKGFTVFEDIVLPRNITHTNGRKIPKIIHITAKTRCVTSTIEKHILRWKFPNHSLYLHDDDAVYRLLNYATNDRYGNVIVNNFAKGAMCMTSGATLSDIWRYTLLYYYGGIYTDIDCAPGGQYSIDLIQPDTDAFFFVEAIGTLSQYYFASSKFHPILLHALKTATNALWESINVMKNLPAHKTGPWALKMAMILFRRAINVTSEGYEPEGIYNGGVGYELESTMAWYNKSSGSNINSINDVDDEYYKEYPSPIELFNRTVTVLGSKGSQAELYIKRNGMGNRQKHNYWKATNMTHYIGAFKKFPKINQISCKQHVSRMMTMTMNATMDKNATIVYNKNDIASLVAQYEYREGYYYDKKNKERIIPWGDKDNKSKKG
mmetsp:Transcript_4482/g.5130  ORF Transcript_4482/g.5130 Transcript_4482/m.5130 type:complete len:477 (+) Transcript_4482:78-1508(+)